MSYDYIVVGGGISGLNTCLKLVNGKNKILLLERNNRLGGRLHTYNEKGQRLFLEYKHPNYRKIESTDEIVNHVKSFYQEDYKVWYNSLNK